MTVDTDSLPSQEKLNEMFATLNLSRLKLPDASELTQRNSVLFSHETMRWLEQNYGNTSLDNNEEQLEQLLALFGNGTGVTPLFVRSLVRQVSRLQATLTTINNLSRDATNSPIRLPLDELLTQARTLRLIDNSVVQELLRHETLLRQRFLAQVDGSRLHFSSLTEQSRKDNSAYRRIFWHYKKVCVIYLTNPSGSRGKPAYRALRRLSWQPATSAGAGAVWRI